MRSSLPKGVSTFLPDGAALRRRIERTALDLLESKGYREVITPLFEYLDVLGPALGEAMVDRGYKFVDRATGRLMILRPDVTPQIARLVAHWPEGKIPLPLRLCYSATVFRHQEEHAGREREILQIGGELIGADGVDADAEPILTAAEILRVLEVKDFTIALGEMGFTRALVRPERLSESHRRPLLGAIARRDATAAAEAAEEAGLPRREREAIAALCGLWGGEEVLAQAARLAANLPDGAAQANARAALERLRRIGRLAAERGLARFLLFDLAETRAFDYYTGAVFEIFVPGIGFEIGGGGRYDRLVEKFGRPLPATGFAFHLERLQQVVFGKPGRGFAARGLGARGACEDL